MSGLWGPLCSGGVGAVTYVHGVVDSGPWRRRWLNPMRQRRALTALPEQVDPHSLQRERLNDQVLTSSIGKASNASRVLDPLGPASRDKNARP